MSRIDDLIKQYAPDGVERKTLGELCTVFNGYAFKSTSFNTNGVGLPLIRIRDVNTGFSGTYYSGEYDARWLVRDGDILIGMDGDFRAIRWRHGRALLNQRVCRLQDFSNEILPGYALYKVQGELDRIHRSIEGSTVKHLSSRQLQRSQIPVPPLEIQAEIVRILDSYTALEADLQAELEAELEARRQQYAHYQDALLAFSDEGGVRRLPMGEIGTFIRGRRFTKRDMVDVGVPSIHYGEIYTHYGVSAVTTLSHVRNEISDQLRYAKPGDVVIAGVGETVEDVAKAVAWLGETDVAIHDDSWAFRSDADPTYIAYAMRTADFQAQKNNHVARAKVKRISGESLGKIVIPVPDIDEQRRIVGILNKFDALVTGLSSGLPAEIAARRQQYAHYRDRLLSFGEGAA